jgi:hypothetical protein
MEPPKPPKMSDFDLTNIRIEPAENGCIVECSYKMKPEVQKKMSGKKGEYVDYDVRNPSIKKVFTGEQAEEIKEAMHATLHGKEEAKATTKSKPKVSKV